MNSNLTLLIIREDIWCNEIVKKDNGGKKIITEERKEKTQAHM
jgi:hypothetical protein